MDSLNSKRESVYQLTSRHRMMDERILHRMAETLRDAGYKSAVVCPHQKHFSFKNVKMIACPLTANRKSKWLRLTAPWRLFWFALRNKHCKVFEIHDPDMLKIGLLLKIFGRRVVYDIHEDYETTAKTQLARFGRFASWIGSKLWWYYEGTISRFFDGFTVADRHIANKFAWKNPPILGNSPPLNFTEVADTTNEKTFNLIFVGSITQVRGVPVVLEALKFLPYEDIRFHIIGNCFDDRIKQQMKSEERVTYHGRVAWSELHKFYKKSHLGIALYQPIPTFLCCHGEGVVKIQEYMAAGIAVLTSNFPGLIKFVNDAEIGLTVQPDDPQKIAEKIELLYKDRYLLKKLGQNGRRLFEEKYNWDLHKYKLIDLYEKILE